MAIVTSENDSRTLADLLRTVGDVALERIRRPFGNATEDDVIRLVDGDDKHICELVDGFLVEKAMGLREAILAAFFTRVLGVFASQHNLGLVFGTDGPVRIKRGRIRFPDTGFIPWDRIPGGVVPSNPITDIVPALCVEVISASNTRREMAKKLKDYFKAGVQLVWYVYPKTQSVVVYTSPTQKTELDINDSLDGGKILPGFSLPLVEVFGQFQSQDES